MRAARIPTGIDSTTPMAVDTTPIATVCQAAATNSPPSAPKLGGIIQVNTSMAGPTHVTEDTGLTFSATRAARQVATRAPLKKNRAARSRMRVRVR